MDDLCTLFKITLSKPNAAIKIFVVTDLLLNGFGAFRLLIVVNWRKYIMELCHYYLGKDLLPAKCQAIAKKIMTLCQRCPIGHVWTKRSWRSRGSTNAWILPEFSLIQLIIALTMTKQISPDIMRHPEGTWTGKCDYILDILTRNEGWQSCNMHSPSFSMTG